MESSEQPTRSISAPTILAVLACCACLVTAGVILGRWDANRQHMALYVDGLPRPNPYWSPREVVQMQLSSLQFNGPDNRGIALCFEFASPSNRAQAGPLDRFVQIIRSDPYQMLLNHYAASFAPIEMNDQVARQVVRVQGADGRFGVFVFMLSRQREGPFAGCWMTDGVMRVPLQPGDAPVLPDGSPLIEPPPPGFPGIPGTPDIPDDGGSPPPQSWGPPA